MTFDIVPGNALGCRTNAHRHGWDGSICDDAANWACGIEADFRSKYCAAGTPRCFHLHLFDDDEPSLVIPDSGVGWLLGQNPNAFDDQILLIWAPQAEEPSGIVDGRPVGSFMAGAYRIESVERVEQRNHIEWKIHPYEDGWTYMGSLETQAPRFIHLGGPYIKQVDAKSVGPLFEAAVEAGEKVSEYWTQDEKERLIHFAANIDEWLEVAEQRILDMGIEPRGSTPAPATATRPGARSQTPAAKGKEPELATRLIPLPPKQPVAEAPSRYPLIEEAKRRGIEATYGSDTLHSLQVAAMTHPLVLLRGPAGVGKSRLALDFIEDPNRERSLVVAVGADWQGAGDLLGKWNPGAGMFEPTLFTNFMRAAELAWRSGDFATRIVVFENFDLSPPEEWLSEVLMRTQYPPAFTSDRTIQLDGSAVRGWAKDAGSRLLISPSVRFVATVDEPVRNGTLTPRLLDDVGVVELSITTAAALKLIEPLVTPEQVEALITLDAITRPLHAGLTFTTVNAIQTCLRQLDELGVDAWKAADFVLEQEVVAKLELLNPGSVEETVGHQAIAWSEGPGVKFTRCAARLAAWGAQSSRSGVFEGA